MTRKSTTPQFYRGFAAGARTLGHPRCWPGLVLWGVLALIFLGLTSSMITGCRGFAEPAPEEAQGESPHNPQAVALYDSVLATYAEQDIEVEVASDSMLLVSSPFMEVEAGLRRRVITRVIAFGRNVALNVVVEYQERAGQGSDGWEAVDAQSAWAKRAAQEELELGRAVERHFHRHQRGRR
ncbi:MAG: hypothetical protein ACNA8W_03600 [Bradymonadaceae bacterium]